MSPSPNSSSFTPFPMCRLQKQDLYGFKLELLKRKASIIGPSLPGSLARLCSVNVGELAKAEAVGEGGVGKTVDSNGAEVSCHLERFANLLVEFEVGDRTPELGF